MSPARQFLFIHSLDMMASGLKNPTSVPESEFS